MNATRDIGIFLCPVCETVIEGDRPCPNRNLRPHEQVPNDAHPEVVS